MLIVEEMDETIGDWQRKLLFCLKNVQINKFKGPMQFCEYILR
jgi:hypothetical protein